LQYFKLGDHQITVDNYKNHFLILKERNSDSSLIAILGYALYKAEIKFIKEVISTEHEICLQLNEQFNSKSIYKIIETCEKYYKEKTIGLTQQKVIYKLPVYFETNKDWALIEKECGISKDSYINELLHIDFTIAMYGFLPGFLYLNGLPKHLHCKRKSSPTTNIKPNSLAIGAQYLGLYSIPSPAGWNVIGEAALPITNIPNLPPNLLNIGDTINVTRIDDTEYVRLIESNQNIINYNEKS